MGGQKVIRERVPNLAESVKHGVFFPETGHSLNPYQMCLELKSEFERLGGNWCEEEIEKYRCQLSLGSIIDAEIHARF
ncbi:FAD-dependent oxidoreductase [Vibrio sinaloensis]|nr:FAD-dependent oxidoreductase [Vibrio sinaloensis]